MPAILRSGKDFALCNYHSHSTYCDGQASCEAMAEAALAKGYAQLGFSSHAPLPYHYVSNMDAARLPAYKDEVAKLRSSFAPRGLEIKLGLEIDYIKNVVGPRDPLFAGLDFSLASIHFIDFQGPGRLAVDGSQENFDQGLARIAAAGTYTRAPARVLYEAYYESLCDLIALGGFSILAHLDLVKKNSGGHFSEEERAYREAALAAATACAEKNFIVEINIGGLLRRRCPEPYPSLFILRRLCELRVPITISADAHGPEQLGAGLQSAYAYARSAGYRHLAIMAGADWIEVPLPE